ncbi:hypothetical protein HDU83_006134 [Entophlyctis luteolus]|nr:hypothetical protein HDU83_006134 [Entophlyctis luteolus]
MAPSLPSGSVVQASGSKYEFIDQAVNDLRKTFDSGKTKSLDWRRDQLTKLYKFVTEKEPLIASALQADLNKCPTEISGELVLIANEAAHALTHLDEWVVPAKCNRTLATLTDSAIVRREPLGVTLIIAPWNFPFQLVLSPLVAAIAAGNCAILKPSELSSASEALLVEWIPRIFDDSAIKVVAGGISESSHLLGMKFDHIFFTGSSNVGKIVMSAAAKQLTPVTLELGGKNPSYIHHDVNVEIAARRLCWARFMNAGQICICPDYVMVHQKIYRPLIEALKRATIEMYTLNPKSSKDFGRIINTAHTRRLINLITRQLNMSNSKLELGGDSSLEDRFVAPTIISGVNFDDPLMEEEIFGPIIAIIEVENENVAISAIKKRERPLALYVHSSDNGVVQKVLDNTLSGMSVVNDYILTMTLADMPFGGVGGSGMGLYHGHAGFLVLIAVVGTTGVGKSNLAIQLAQRLNGEVINADSMQVYRGLDIVTNKVSVAEQAAARHHLLSFVDPSEEYSVLQFERDALRVIADIHGRGKLPILVGGTHYYIQSILWDSSLVGHSNEDSPSAVGEQAHPSLPATLAQDIEHALKQTSVESFRPESAATQKGLAAIVELRRLLRVVDPRMADRWHPNDWRKIRRSLKVFYTGGRRHSDILDAQKHDEGGRMRFRTCMFWLWAENAVLDERLDKRVQDMINNGLFSEIMEMRKKVRADKPVAADETEDTNAIDYSRGILQTIGFKEFDAYLNAFEEQGMQPTPDETFKPLLTTKSGASVDLDELRRAGISSMQAATRRYARRQVTWIRNKLGPKCLGDALDGSTRNYNQCGFWALNATDLELWPDRVGDRAARLYSYFINGSEGRASAAEVEDADGFTRRLLGDDESGLDGEKRNRTGVDWVPRECAVCADETTGLPRVVHGSREWEVHIRSNAHARMVKRQKRREELQRWREEAKRRKDASGAAGDDQP